MLLRSSLLVRATVLSLVALIVVVLVATQVTAADGTQGNAASTTSITIGSLMTTFYSFLDTLKSYMNIPLAALQKVLHPHILTLWAFLEAKLPPQVYSALVSATTFVLSLTFRQWIVSFLGYVALMFVYRVFETKQLIAAPSVKGWMAHAADAVHVHNEFQHFLRERKEGEKVSINRSKGGHSDSNRTIAADYKKKARRVDVSALDCVIAVDHAKNLMHIEPGLPMDEMARVAIAYGVVPEVVLEFPGITAGGALCGGGIESTSHKFGSFYDTVEEVDIVTGDGVWRKNVSRTNEPELFAALATSYGTHGILTRIAVRVEPAPKYVHVRYIHTETLASATAAMTALANETSSASNGGANNKKNIKQSLGAPAFVDGVAMSPTSSMVVVGDGCNEAPAGVPFRSLRNARSDPWFFWHLTSISRKIPALKISSPSNTSIGWRNDAGFSEYMSLDDYLFRFDRGAFWMARHGLHVFYGGFAYNGNADASAGPSWFLRVKYSWLATTRQLYRMLHAIGDEGLARTYIVQDYIMPGPVEACKLSEFTNKNKIGIWPLWICPVRMVSKRHPSNAGFGFPVQKTVDQGLMFNVGVYGLPNNGSPFDPVDLNKALENEATRLDGRKMLYAQSFYSKDEFWSLFDKKAYETIRSKYKGDSVFPDIATKLLLGETRMQSMRGEQMISFSRCAKDMALWYFSLWVEIFTPRSWHPKLNIQFTGMSQYKNATAEQLREGEGRPSSSSSSSDVSASSATTTSGFAASGATNDTEDREGPSSSKGGARRRRQA